MQELTIKRLTNTNFKSLYLKFLQGKDLNDAEIIKLLAIAVLLLNHTTLELKRLGYRIVLFYSNITGRYEALYDVTINSGLFPVSAVIGEYLTDENDHRHDSFLRNFIGSYIDTFREQGIVLSAQQEALKNFVQDEYRSSLVVIAPTSYGKSELIIKSVRDNPSKRVLILVPSKALLAQTKKRLIDADILNLGKIVTHPEMYSADRDNRAFVLTQERLARLLNEYPTLSFDMVFVDEAHNLLQGDHRNELLATVICMLGARNSITSFKFLTPFLCNELNIRIRYLDMAVKGFKIDEYIKSERFYLQDFRTEKNDSVLKFYDHFLNEWINLNQDYKDCFDLVIGESLSKNIIYGNKPKSIEAFAEKLADQLPEVNCPLVATACDELEETFDKRYRLIACLRRGVMYHHGSIPDTVRLYLENLFTKSSQMKYLVCNATLLEGVNLPIERLFLFDFTKGRNKLTSSQFKNLIGRVNRFSEVFTSGRGAGLKKLESSVYLMGVDGFTSKRANLIDFYQKAVNVSRVDKDSVNNVLLEATEIVDGKIATRFEDAVERLENLQPGIVLGRNCKYVTTEVGKLLIANGVNEIDVFKTESKIENEISVLVKLSGAIETADTLMNAIKRCFIDYFDESREYSDLTRLKEPAALSFYAMLLDWKLKKYTVKQTIRLTIKYWNSRIDVGSGDHVFVGKWGDTKYKESPYKHWVNIATKNDIEKINLAIVRTKEEEDFFDYKIFRFVEVLNGVGAIAPNFYKQIKYGTTNETKIMLIRDGFSRGLADLLLQKYPNFVRLTSNGNIEVQSALLGNMRENEESDLLIFEAQMNLKTESSLTS